MFCTNCGYSMPSDVKICPNCGFALTVPQQENCPKEDMQANQNFDTDSDICSYAKNKYYKPLSTSQFFFVQLLFIVPVVNLFFIFLWALKKNVNKNLKAYSRSMLIWLTVLSIFSIFALLTVSFILNPLPFNVFRIRINL